MTSNSIEMPLPWYRTITSAQWKTLLAAKLGWMLDAMDFVIFIMAMDALKEHFQYHLFALFTRHGNLAGALATGPVARAAGSGHGR
jgi:hypothetical protein